MPVTITHGGVQRIFAGVGFGRGMARYERAQGYIPSAIPTAVGARYFLGAERSDFDEDDVQLPIAMGNKWDGGRPVYRERVYAAMKKHPLVKQKEADEVKPRKVA
ncbi:MAG: hypothetical protein LN413_07010 [Candidatus Thermoplasmatota archaeon]|nr:hypothetical protein [Candidatus Thermoplasmatota archaeon]